MTEAPTETVQDHGQYVYDTHVTALWNTINFLGRGMAFYLAINAALFGYILTAKLHPSIQQKVLLVGLLTSILFSICSIVCIWWCRQMGSTIKRSIEERAPSVFDSFGIEANFKKGQVLFLTFGTCMLILVAVIMGAYVYLLVVGPQLVNPPAA